MQKICPLRLNWPGRLAGISEGAWWISKWNIIDHFSPSFLSQNDNFKTWDFSPLIERLPIMRVTKLSLSHIMTNECTQNQNYIEFVYIQFYVILWLKENIMSLSWMLTYTGPPGQARQARFGPCLDFGLQYALVSNNWPKKIVIQYWTLPGSNS